MDKPFDYIFIDTSVFQSEAYFKKSGAVSRLFDLAEKGWIKVLMPEITEREWLKHFTEATFLRFTDIDKKATLMDNTAGIEDFSVPMAISSVSSRRVLLLTKDLLHLSSHHSCIVRKSS